MVKLKPHALQQKRLCVLAIGYRGQGMGITLVSIPGGGGGGDVSMLAFNRHGEF